LSRGQMTVGCGGMEMPKYLTRATKNRD